MASGSFFKAIMVRCISKAVSCSRKGLYINIKISKKKLLNVRLAGDHLFGKLLFTWLSLVMSIMVSFCAVRFPTRCLG